MLTPRDDYIKCGTCGELFDPADLSAVFRHEHDNQIPEPEWSGITQVVDSKQINRLERMIDD